MTSLRTGCIVASAILSLQVVSKADVILNADNSAANVTDTFIFAATSWYGSPTVSHATSDMLRSCSGGWTYASNFLIRFDSLPAIPDGYDVSKVELVLYRLDSSSNYGSSKIVAAAPFTESDIWTSAASANKTYWYGIASPYVNIAMGATSGYKTADVTSIVSGWLADPSTNTGFLIANNASGSWTTPGLEIASSDHATAEYRPQLVFTLTAAVPEPASLAGMAAGCLLLARRRGSRHYS